jgi:hypothetical protein
MGVAAVHFHGITYRSQQQSSSGQRHAALLGSKLRVAHVTELHVHVTVVTVVTGTQGTGTFRSYP